jgi:hypothetical protein
MSLDSLNPFNGFSDVANATAKVAQTAAEEQARIQAEQERQRQVDEHLAMMNRLRQQKIDMPGRPMVAPRLTDQEKMNTLLNGGVQTPPDIMPAVSGG